MSALEVRDISVRFGGHDALCGVDLDAPAGRITGLIGPNGAGKTTLFNVLCGLQRPLDGTVHLDGVDLTGLAPHRRARLGVARTFQRLETFTLLTVRENILAGAEFRRRWASSDRSPAATADALLQQLELDDVAEERVDRLPTGRARVVELARALAADPRMLLLDEPSSGLDNQETAALGEVLTEVAASGPGILLVEHDMAMVSAICDRVTVLDFGSVIAEGPPTEIRDDPHVQQAYLGLQGARATLDRATTTSTVGPPVLEVRGLRAGYAGIDVLDGVDLTMAAGEVLAIVGPNGAGKTTFLKALAGLVPARTGTISVLGHDTTHLPADALARAGLCMVPEGRGVFPNLTVGENLWLMGAGAPRSEIEARAFSYFPQLADRRSQVAGTLSGGEQQMLAMARALAGDPAVLVLDELSMGLAPVIVSRLYDEVRRLAEAGLTILVVEQFAHEILGVADRAAIMLHGHLGQPDDPAAVADRLADAYLTGAAS